MKINLFSMIFLLIALTTNASEHEAKISYLRGNIEVIRNNQNLIAQSGMKLFPGDKIKASDGAQATIDLGDEKFIRINSRTGFEIPSNQSPNLIKTIHLHFGQIWASVKTLLAGESFTVKTPTATAGVRGTDFQMSFNEIDKITQTSVHNGTVMVKNSLGEVLKLTDGMLADISNNIMKTVQDQLAITQKFVNEAAKIPLDESEKALREAEQLVNNLNQQINEMIKKQMEETQKMIDKTMKDTNDMIQQQLQQNMKLPDGVDTNFIKDLNNSLGNSLNDALKDINSDLGQTLNEAMQGIGNFNLETYQNQD